MAAVAKNPAFAKKVGIKPSVGEEFLKADKGKKFGTGGDVNYTYGGKGQINKQRTRGGSIFGVEKNVPNVNLNKYIGKKEGGVMKESKEMMQKEVAFMKKKGAPKSMLKHEMAEAKGMKEGGSCKMEAKKEVKSHEKRMHNMARGGGIETKGKTKGTMVKMAGGGFVKSADGCATKGKTKGTQVAMKKGGKC